MTLVEGMHHATFLTEDMDRLTTFYERVLDARKTVDMTEEGVRHVFLEVGSTTVLHPFELIEGPPLPDVPGTMFHRGRLDHFALLSPSEEAFREIRRRADAEGAADGDIRDTGSMWIMAFNDPDGFYVEVIWRKPGVSDADTLERAEWSTVDLADR
jgi:catechol 2,3-dioxygenase-like lactoylglutathione lyase family enzyme